MTSPAGMARACSAWSTRSCMPCVLLPEALWHGLFSRDYAGPHRKTLATASCTYVVHEARRSQCQGALSSHRKARCFGAIGFWLSRTELWLSGRQCSVPPQCIDSALACFFVAQLQWVIASGLLNLWIFSTLLAYIVLCRCDATIALKAFGATAISFTA